MLKQRRDALAVMVPSDGFAEKPGQLQNNELLACAHALLGDGERVRYKDHVDAVALLELLEGVATEEPVRRNDVHLLRPTALDDRFGCGDPAAPLIDHVVDDKYRTASDVSNKGDHLLQVVIDGVIAFLVTAFRGVV